MLKHKIEIKIEKCIGCGLCKKDCPVHNITLIDNKAVINDQNCMKCGHCVAVCPKGAVSMKGYETSPIEYTKQVVLNSDDLLQAIQKRRSVRFFKHQNIPEEFIRKIIEAGRYTPTAENKQEVSYIILQEHLDMIEKKADTFFRRILPLARFIMKNAKGAKIDDNFTFKKAPLVILVLAKGRFAHVDGSLAAANMALMAESCGLGLFYSGFFTLAVKYSRAVRKALGLTAKEKVVMTLVIGYPDVQYHRTVQREEAVVRYL